MERAAFALHVHVVAALRELRGAVGGRAGGGAGRVRQQRGRRAVRRGAARPAGRGGAGGAHRRARARGRAGRAAPAGGRVLRVEDGRRGGARSRPPTSCWTACSASAPTGPGCAGQRATWSRRSWRAGRPYVVAVDVPSGLGVDDGRRDGVGAGRRPHGDVRRRQARAAAAARRARRGTGRAGRPRARAGAARPRSSGSSRPTSPTCGPCRPPTRTSTRGASSGSSPGSRAYPGAAVLTTGAAVRAGVGMVRYLGDAGDAVVAAHPEVVVGHGRVQAWVFGPGVSPGRRRAATPHRVRARARAGRAARPAVVDAGAPGAAARRAWARTRYSRRTRASWRALLSRARRGRRPARASRPSRCAGRAGPTS